MSLAIACKKLKYSGAANERLIGRVLACRKKEYFHFDKENGWCLTNKGQNEFSRLKQFI